LHLPALSDRAFLTRRVRDVTQGEAADGAGRYWLDHEELTSLLHETGGDFAAVARRLGPSRGAVIHRAQEFGLLARPRGRV
jgi:hypothetical protein